MITKQTYVEYLISTPINYTCTNLAEHLEGVSHDAITDYLSHARLTTRQVWEIVQRGMHDSPEAFLIVDDSVQDKRYSQKIELVKRQYSGTQHGIVRGIGVVNLVQTTGQPDDFYPTDYRIYAPEVDGKTKNEYFREMLIRALADKGIQARRILFDSWYAAADTLKQIHRADRFFYTTLKENRMVSLSKETGYVHLQEIDWTEECLHYGIVVHLKALPFPVRLFKLVATDGSIDWLITNELDETITAQVAEVANDLRWQVEELHRGLKQPTGTEKCQCRKARSQRNHLACCYHAWLSLKVYAQRVGLTLYQARTSLFANYLRAELLYPTITAC
jgi:hypothetical protein